jgi:hypothetical protein
MGGEAERWRGLPRSAGVGLAASAYLVVTTFLAWRLNLWRDEMYSLHSTSGSPRFAFDQAIHFELQPPVYFVALALWRSIEASPFFARLFSVLCGALHRDQSSVGVGDHRWARYADMVGIRSAWRPRCCAV